MSHPTTPHLRPFQGPADYPIIAEVLTASEQTDRSDQQVRAADIAAAFEGDLGEFDPAADLCVAEAAGQAVGYTRVWWEEQGPALRLYRHNTFLKPEGREGGIGRALLDWAETRLREIAGRHPPALEKQLQANASRNQEGAAALLKAAGYQPVHYFFEMARSNLEDIPDHPLPEGLEIRPVTPDHYPAIWQSIEETSREEWGHAEFTEADYQEWLSSPHFQPDLWPVAWDAAAEKVAGHVLTYISPAENQQFDRLRGYTEGIGVSPAWRRRGLAKALIARSLQAQKTAGMTESALIADSDSAYGTKALYESCGFQVINQDAIYRKPL